MIALNWTVLSFSIIFKLDVRILSFPTVSSSRGMGRSHPSARFRCCWSWTIPMWCSVAKWCREALKENVVKMGGFCWWRLWPLCGKQWFFFKAKRSFHGFTVKVPCIHFWDVWWCMNLIWSHKFSSIFHNLSEKTRTLMSQCVKTRTFWLIPTTRLTLQNAEGGYLISGGGEYKII